MSVVSPPHAAETSSDAGLNIDPRVLARLLTKGLMAVATAAALLLQPVAGVGLVWAQEASQTPTIQGISRQPSQASFDALLDPNDAVLLLLDHQTGLFQTVDDIDVATLRANTVALAKIAEQAGIPIIYTASEPDGPNGPIMPELADRTGEECVRVGEAVGTGTHVQRGKPAHGTYDKGKRYASVAMKSQVPYLRKAAG